MLRVSGYIKLFRRGTHLIYSKQIRFNYENVGVRIYAGMRVTNTKQTDTYMQKKQVL